MEPHEFKKHSRIGTVISAIGIIIILVSVVIFMVTVKNKDRKFTEAKNSLVLSRDTVKLFESKVVNDIVECTAVPLSEKASNGNPLYRFTLKISDSSFARQLSRVDYYFSDPSFDPKLKVSKDSLSNFSITYKGWGCMVRVPVFLHYRLNNKTDTIIFFMCDKTKILLKKQ